MVQNSLPPSPVGYSSLLPAKAARCTKERWTILTLAAFALLFAAWADTAFAQTPTPVNVTTWRYDNTHQGQNTQETLLTPANVGGGNFGKLFSYAVDGYVYAQPLYMSGLTMPDGKVHNVLFIATEHDSVYAFDADTNGGSNAFPLWQISMLSPAYGAAAGATTVTDEDLGSTDIIPEIGITSTPAINPATQTMYLVAKTLENGTYVQRLHALNYITGAEQPGSPVEIQASVPGTGTGSSGGVLPFSPEWQNNRVAVGYYNGYVYLGFGSHGDNGPWHGWVLAYNATTLAQTAAYCTTANGSGAGIWGAGAGLPIDNDGPGGAGRMFLVTGNGTSSTSYPPINAGTSMANSIVRLDLSNGGLNPTDGWSPYNSASLTAQDLDQGSGGILMLPDQPGSYPHEMVQAGKNGVLEVLNRDNLGGPAPTGGTSNTNILQDIDNAISGLWSTPAYWNGNLYGWGQYESLYQFPVKNGVVQTQPAYVGGITSRFPGAIPSVSSNGTQNGIVWAVRTDQFYSFGDEVLYAFNANNVSDLLYESDTLARDNAGDANKFVVPVVTNGKVYVAAAYQINVYGLLNGQAVAASPTFSPAAGTYGAPINVTIASSTPGATIYYTLDGSTPTNSSAVYTGPIPISSGTTVNALASAAGYLQSAVSSAVYNFVTQTQPVTFMPAAGTYTSAQTVTLTDATPNATIYYTTDGSTPTTASAVYSSPIAVSATTTINALAVSTSASPSNIATGVYTISSGTNIINFGTGFSSTAGLTLNGSAKATDDSRLQLTDGGLEEFSSVYNTVPVNIQAFTTNFTFQDSDATADGLTFVIQNANVNAVGPNGGGLGYGSPTGVPGGGIGNSVAVKFDIYNNQGEGTDSTGLYTDGAYPTTPSIDMTSSGVLMLSGHEMLAQLTYDGTNLTLTVSDVVANATFTHTWQVNIPQIVGSNQAWVGFTGGAGGASSSQKILNWTYSSTTPGAATAAVPVISPAGGNFTTPQTVTMASTTPGATIYYTTNGNTPTTSSTVYTGPVTIGPGTTIVNAMATAPNYAQSATATATFTIQSFSLSTGNATVSVAAGQGASQAVTVVPVGGFPGTVTFGVSGLPTGATGIFTPAVSPSGTTLAISTASTVAAGNYTITVTGTSGAETSSTTFTLAVSAAQAVAAPTFSPAGGSFTTAQLTAVALADTTTGATIYYTTNGSSPSTSSAVYASPIAVGAGTTTISAIAVSNGTQSSPASATYIVTQPAAATPVFTVAGGTYSTPQTVGLTDSTPGSTIYYTTNGNTATTSSAVYTGPISVGPGTTVVNAIATAPNYAQSAMATATFAIQSFSLSTATPTLSVVAGQGGSEAVKVTPSGGFAGSVGFSVSGLPTGATGTFTPGSSTTGSSLGIVTASNVAAGSYTITIAGTSGSVTATTTFTLAISAAQPVAAPLFSPAGGSFTTAQLTSVALADTTTGAVIYYTTNGSSPTTSSAVYAGPIAVGAGTTTINAIAVAGGVQSSTATATYIVTQPVTAAPAFSVAGGTYATAQTVGLTDSTAGAAIYYTTNGSTPTATAAELYKGPIAIASGTTTIKAIAVATGSTQSAVSSATYTITPAVTPAPQFTPAAGNYTSNQLSAVTISDSNTTAKIYYTTNGTTPTTSSAVYSGPIAVSPGTTTIQAIALATGDSASTVTTATYTVTASPAPAPVFTPGSGKFFSTQSITITDTVGNAAIYYTTNGTAPTAASQLYKGPIVPPIGTTMYEAIAIAPGAAASPAATAKYSITQAVTATPVFTPPAGSYTAAQNVTITDATPGAAIYYTTNGSMPTTASTLYKGAIAVGSGVTTIRAIAVAPGYAVSSLASAAYHITALVKASPVQHVLR